MALNLISRGGVAELTAVAIHTSVSGIFVSFASGGSDRSSCLFSTVFFKVVQCQSRRNLADVGKFVSEVEPARAISFGTSAHYKDTL